MNLSNASLTLENDSQFYRQYTSLKNRDTSRSTNESGKSASVQRRTCISSSCYRLLDQSPTMLEVLQLEKYFNERYELCPYGLDDEPPKPKSIKEEPIMSSKEPAIKVVTYVYGQDIATLTDAQMYEHIARIENEMAVLAHIKSKPNKLVVQLGEMQKQIEALVALIDAR